MGKSSVLRLIIADYAARDDAKVSFIATPSFSSDFAFLKAITSNFDLPPKRSLYDQRKALEQFLLEQFKLGLNVIVFVDEAQSLKPPMLEMVRTMLNFETNTAKLIQIVMAGQMELKERLLDPVQKALRSRVFAPSVLAPLTLGETKAMIAYRCEQAEIPVPFSDDVIREIYEVAAGVPREILKVCAISFEMARVNGLTEVTSEVFALAKDEAVLS